MSRYEFDLFTVLRGIVDLTDPVYQAVYLVGGFAASPYLVSQIRERLSGGNIAVHVPDGQT